MYNHLYNSIKLVKNPLKQKGNDQFMSNIYHRRLG